MIPVFEEMNPYRRIFNGYITIYCLKSFLAQVQPDATFVFSCLCNQWFYFKHLIPIRNCCVNSFACSVITTRACEGYSFTTLSLGRYMF